MTAPRVSPRVALVADTVLTMEGTGVAQCIVVNGDRIVAVGGRELTAAEDTETTVIDFGARTIVPGFIDPHVHVELVSVAEATAVPVHTPPCESIDDIVETLRAHSDYRERRHGWLIGEGNLIQDARLRDHRVPTRRDLDRVSTTFPVAVRIGAHTTVLNSVAVELTGVAKLTRLPGSAVVDRDSGGDVTGVVRELFYLLPIPTLTGADLREAIRGALRSRFLEFGVTGIGDIPRSWSAVEAYDDLLATGKTHVRIDVYGRPGPMGSLQDVIERCKRWNYRSAPGWLDLSAIKLFADGGLSAATAATLKPYAGRRGSRGRLHYHPRTMRAMLRQIFAAGLPALIHTVGERSQVVVCDALHRLRVDEGFGSAYVRLEHAGNYISDPAVLDAWDRAGIVPVPNIVMLYSYGDAMPRYFGRAHTGVRFPLRTLSARGYDLAVGSDVTGDEPRGTNPLFGMWCATQRRAWNGEPVDVQEALEPIDVLRMQTISAARVLRKADDRGSLAPGKLADIVVLDRDPTRTAPEELLATNVDLVMVGGSVAHYREASMLPHVSLPRSDNASAGDPRAALQRLAVA